MYAGLMTTKSKSQLVISMETSPDEAQQVGREARQRGLEIPSVYGGGALVHRFSCCRLPPVTCWSLYTYVPLDHLRLKHGLGGYAGAVFRGIRRPLG